MCVFISVECRLIYLQAYNHKHLVIEKNIQTFITDIDTYVYLSILYFVSTLTKHMYLFLGTLKNKVKCIYILQFYPVSEKLVTSYSVFLFL